MIRINMTCPRMLEVKRVFITLAVLDANQYDTGLVRLRVSGFYVCVEALYKM